MARQINSVIPTRYLTDDETVQITMRGERSAFRLRIWRGRTSAAVILVSQLPHGPSPSWGSLLNTVEFNWFAAPQHWQLALPRFLMGFGSAMVLMSMTAQSSCDPNREAKIQPFLQVAQFLGGALSIGVLVTTLLIEHQIQYSYAADRGFIQSVEQSDHRQRLDNALNLGGVGAPDRQANSLLYSGVNYVADNLVFSEIYAGFFLTSAALACLCLVCWFVTGRNSTYRSFRPVPAEGDEAT